MITRIERGTRCLSISLAKEIALVLECIEYAILKKRI